jgi:predicted molibdopterin-dependent oxidoreductase YjgC
LFVEKLEFTNVALKNPWEQPGQEDDFLLRADLNPNTRGAKDLGFSGNAKPLLEKAAAGDIKVLYIIRHHFDDPEALELLDQASRVIYHGTNWNGTAEAARIVFPGTTHAEKDGTFTNCDGIVQEFKQALLPIEDSRDDRDILCDLAEKLGQPLKMTAEVVG